MKKYPYIMKIRGNYYEINKRGYIKRTDMENLKESKSWKIYGVSERWNGHPILWEEVKRKIDKEGGIKGYLYDIDHGTIRFWGGNYMGKLPKVTIFKN